MNEIMNTTQVINDNVLPTTITTDEPKIQSQLGQLLQEARESKGLNLSDVASLTHVRKEYLSALDEGRYEDLPENVYTRNFLRLYAQAIDLEEKPILELYSQERYGVLISETTKPIQSKPHLTRSKKTLITSSNTRLWAILLSFAVLAVLLIGAWRIFALPEGKGGWLFSLPWVPEPVTSQAPEPAPVVSPFPLVEETIATGSPANVAGINGGENLAPVAPANDLVMFSITTVPEGARVSLDRYDLGLTPIFEAPLTPVDKKVLQISLEGYETIEKSIEFTNDVTLSYVLVEEGTVEEGTISEASDLVTSAVEIEQTQQNGVTPSNLAESVNDETSTTAPENINTGKITIDIEEASWLEVYSGTARNSGETLVYSMAQQGESFTFDLPVYVRAGNSAAVHIKIDGQDRGYLSDSGSGAVLGQAFE